MIFIEDLNSTAGDPRVYLRIQQGVWDGVKVPVYLDMAVDFRFSAAPFGINTRLHGERLQSIALDLIEECLAAGPKVRVRPLLNCSRRSKIAAFGSTSAQVAQRLRPSLCRAVCAGMMAVSQ